jgi:site-specific recombinase XerD
MKTPLPDLARLLQAFFTERLLHQRQASDHTVAAYRDTFRLLLRFAAKTLGKSPSALTLGELDAPFVSRFLDHLEKDRRNSPRSRNARLAAIHSFFRFVALEAPAHSGLIQRVLAIPTKRWERPTIDYLTRPEIDALLGAPNQRTWTGQRDHLLLLVAVQTGLRASELIGLRRQDVVFGTGAHIRCMGKGRKERCTPLTRQSAVAVRRWLHARRGEPGDPLFPNQQGRPLSRDGIAYLLAKHVEDARRRCPSLKRKRVSTHVLRHTTAMQLLHAGVDRSVIALWLGHESIDTTQVYLHADLALKEQALARTVPPRALAGRFRPDDALLAFLSDL